jgi:hypothetical protein
LQQLLLKKPSQTPAPSRLPLFLLLTALTALTIKLTVTLSLRWILVGGTLIVRVADALKEAGLTKAQLAVDDDLRGGP